MAFITLDQKKLKANYTYLDNLFVKNNIQWCPVSKLLCGNKEYLKLLIDLGIQQVCDSRISNLKMIKSLSLSIETLYIKPPAKRVIKSVVQYADISVNTQIETIKMLSQEAVLQKKTHKILIMIEMGELREGIMRENLISFYRDVFKLKNIEVIGIGTNLSCLYGVLPNHDKLIQLVLYEQLIEAKFNKTLKFVSGGSSVTIPLILQRLLPKGINHFRVGETLFLGTDVYNNSVLPKMKANVFSLFAEIIELIEKPRVPSGEMGTNVEGKSFDFDESQLGENSFRAIIDIGLLDVDPKHIQSTDPTLKIIGASSDMLVIDLHNNPKNYKVGDLIEFNLDYMGVLRLLNSKYIEKRIK